MARSAADSVIIRFRLPFIEYKRRPRWVLWPASAWRVVAPRPRPRALNVLQRAALGLSMAGVQRAEDIGRKLLIATDLAAFILEELRGAGWVDAGHRPTQAGRRALEEDLREAVEDTSVGWVFTDPLTGQIWPRFHDGELPYAELERQEDRKPLLLSGTIGDPRRDPAFEIRLRPQDQAHVARPPAEDVLRAARAHRRQHDWEDEPVAADAPALQRVLFVLEEPTDCHLATRVWQPPAGDWQVDDPFGIGQSLRLRRWIEARMETDPALRDWLESVVLGDVQDASLASLTTEATWLVDERGGAAMRALPQLHERLVAMQRAFLETKMDDCPDDKWEDVAIKAQRAAERAFLEVREAHPAGLTLSVDEEFNETLVNELAELAGFQVPLPASLARVRRGKVVHALESGSGSLRALVLVALLGTHDAEHPLRRAAAEFPTLLHKLDELAATRDRAAHEGPSGSPRKRDRAKIRDGVETVFSTVKLLFSK